VVGYALVFLLVALELFLCASFDTAMDVGCEAIGVVMTLDDEERLAVAKVDRVGETEVALAEREVVYGVEHVGLACAVGTDEAIDPVREGQVGCRDVAVVDDVESIERHGKTLSYEKLRDFGRSGGVELGRRR